MHTTASAGRGRGRGRGGEAVLPQGLWDELSGLGAEKDTSDAHKDHDHVRRDYPNPGQFDDGDACMPPAGFGRGRGGMGGGRGRGPEKVI